jgi:predicted Zn-dependent peptidase
VANANRFLFDFMIQNTITQTVNTVKLDNGLTVILAENHSEPQVFGAVAVKVGSKNDPPDHTGMAHYFEHIMFKGTDKIGSVDYASEKPLLDRIADLYDRLPLCSNAVQRSELLHEINQLSIEASRYAISGELDQLLSRYGGSKINAYTDYDHTAYYNIFSPNHINHWLAIYAERFRNPVFRTFQAELETVYEERNMYADMPGARAIEDIYKKVVRKHPYRNPIIGSVEHLKNPSINRMTEFYRQYYVAGNMALVLVGDFDTRKIMPAIEQTFGKHPAGDAPAFPVEQYREEPFKGREFFSGRYIPLKAGAICYRGVPLAHPDRVALEYCAQILSNKSQTGLLDHLRDDNRLNMVTCIPLSLNDMGAVVVGFIPKVFGSLKKNENRMMNIIDRLKSGNFDDEVFNNLKISLVKERAMSVESPERMGNLLVELFSRGQQWDEYRAETERCRTISRQEIIDVANRYFTGNRFVFYNKTGFSGKAEKIKKPEYAPLRSPNRDAQSEFARQLALQANPPSPPIFIDMQKDFTCDEIQPNVHLVTGKNPLNSIFTIAFLFEFGQNANKLVELLPMHLPELGVGGQTVNEFRMAMQKIGSSYEVLDSPNSITIKVNGFDSSFEKTMTLVNSFMKNIEPDNRQIKKLWMDVRSRNKMEYKSLQTAGKAHQYKIMYGEMSQYLNRASSSEVKNMKSSELTELFAKAQQYETTIEYVGTLPHSRVKEIIASTVSFPETVIPSETRNEIIEYSEPFISQLYFHGVTQTDCRVYIPSQCGSFEDRVAALYFTLYFGGCPASVLFHEVRELRSLSYSVYGKFQFPFRRYAEIKGYVETCLSTQTDKTLDAVELLDSLVKELPQQPERITNIQNIIRESINTFLPDFRSIPEYATSLIRQGYSEDFRKQMYEGIDLLDMEKINEFYRKFVSGRPVIHLLSGNTYKMGVDGLSVKKQKLELKDVMRH